MAERYEAQSPEPPVLRAGGSAQGGPGGKRGLAPKKLITRSTAALLVLALLGGGYWYVTRPPSGGAARAAGAPAPPVTVSHPLQKQIVEWDEYTGQFAAVDYVELRARVSGYLDSINFTDGEIVKKGDLLFVIDPRPFQADVDQAQANLLRDKAQVLRAELDLKRYADLVEKNFASRQQYEQARATADSAQATVKADDAALVQAKLNLEFTHITAPLSGRISRHQVSIGNLIVGGNNGSATLLTTIVSLDPIYFYFDMSETDYLGYARAVAQGQLRSTRDSPVPVYARLTDEQQWLHQGRMNFVDNQIDRSSGTIRVRAVFANPDLLIASGQFARLRLPASDAYKALLIPDSAVVTDQSRKIVMTVGPDNTVEPRVIRQGPTYEGLRIVRDGLLPTDTIIINGLIRARVSAKVTPQPGQIAPPPEAD